MYLGITIIGIIIVAVITYFLIVLHFKRKLKKLERGDNEDENKSRKTGEKIDSKNLGYRTPSRTPRTSGEEQYLESASESEGRVLLPNDVIVDDGKRNSGIREVNNSTPKDRKGVRRIFGRRRRNR